MEEKDITIIWRRYKQGRKKKKKKKQLFLGSEGGA
jgi:hypothetical protein